MLAYNLMFLLLVFFSFAERFNLLLSRYVAIYFSILLVILFTSIRGDVGQDTSNYLLMYNDIEKYKEHLEVGFYSLVKLANFIGLSFNGFLLVVSTLFVSFYYAGLAKFVPKKYVILSFLIIFCDLYIYFNISGLRQGIALSICLFSSYFAYRRSFISFLFLVIVAALFHKSAAVFLLVYPLLKLKIDYSYKQIFIIGVCCVLLFYTTKTLFGSESLSFIKGGEMYLSENYNKFSPSAYVVGFLRRFYPIFLFFYFYKQNKNDHVLTSVFNVYLFGFVFYAINYPILQDVTVRFSSYFTMFEAVIVVRILVNLKHGLNKLLVLSIIYFIVYFKIFTYASLDAFEYKLMDGVF